MTAQIGRRAVVTGDDQHIGVERHDMRNDRVELLGLCDLGGEITVFATAVRVLVMQEEEVVVVPALVSSTWASSCEIFRLTEDRHPYQPR